jgi:hypothetical protein
MAIIALTTAIGAFSLISIVLLLVTLPQHVRVRNTGTILMMTWALIGNMAQSITAFMLRNTEHPIDQSTLIWLDINSALQYVYPFGFSLGTLFLMRKLEAIACELSSRAFPFDEPY